jgi:hypothetical protein
MSCGIPYFAIHSTWFCSLFVILISGPMQWSLSLDQWNCHDHWNIFAIKNSYLITRTWNSSIKWLHKV